MKAIRNLKGSADDGGFKESSIGDEVGWELGLARAKWELRRGSNGVSMGLRSRKGGWRGDGATADEGGWRGRRAGDEMVRRAGDDGGRHGGRERRCFSTKEVNGRETCIDIDEGSRGRRRWRVEGEQ